MNPLACAAGYADHRGFSLITGQPALMLTITNPKHRIQARY
jgi:hypothetical protein